ncbi:MAG: hypothetical protein ABIR83_08600 [Nakamurella sp.]
MTTPSYPSPPPSTARRDPQGAPWPGLIPLRPLGIGDLFGAALRLVRAHAALLCLVALGGTVLGGAAVFGVLALLPDNSAYFDDQWTTQLAAGRFVLPPAATVLPLLAGGLISYITTIVVSGLATALIGDASIGRPTGTRAALDRLHGRWWVLIGVSVLVSLLVVIGFAAFVIPGFIVLAMLLHASPIVVLEKAGLGAALQRSVQLTYGLRARILGITVLAYLITSVISSAVLNLLPAAPTLSATVVALAVQAVISAFTVPWAASVIALLYVDTRIRKEGLAQSLVRSSMR